MFSFVIKIAWASLKRRTMRSIMVVLMIAMSLWGLLLMEGVYDGMTEQMIDNAIRSDSGDITIYGPGYREEKDVQKLIKNSEEVFAQLKTMPGISSYTDRIIQECLVATAHYSQNATLFGIDLEAEQQQGKLSEYLIAGSYDFGKRNNGVLLGSRLAERLKVSVGSKLIISAQDFNNEISSLSLKVRGILRTNNMLLDGQALLIAKNTAKQMLHIDNGVHHIAIMLDKKLDTSIVQEGLQRQFSGLEIFRWDQLYPALMQGRVMMEVFNLVTSSIIFSIASLGIFGVMMVSVLERTREFGIMLAIGTPYSRIWAIVLAESMFLGLLGFLFGSLLGFASLYYFHRYGLDLSAFSEAIETFGMDSISYALIRPSYFITAGIAVLLATLASVILPLRILKKAKPVEAIHAI